MPRPPSRKPSPHPGPGGHDGAPPPAIRLGISPVVARERRLRRRRRWIGAGIVLVVLVAALWLSRERVLLPQLARLATSLARQAGLELAIDGLRGNLWNRLEARSITLRNAVPGPLARLAARDVGISYSLPGLLAGDPFALHSVEASELDFELDLGLPPSSEEHNGGGSSTLPSFARNLPAFSIDALDFAIHFAGGRALVGTGGHLEVAASDAARGPQPIALTLESFAWRDGENESAAPLELAATWTRGRIALGALRWGELAPIAAGEADLAELSDGRGSAELELHLAGAPATVAFGLAHGRVEIDVRARDLDLLRAAEELAARDPGLFAHHLPLAAIPSGLWRVDADLSRTLAGGELRGKARVLGERLDIAGRDVQRAEARLDLEGDRLYLRTLDVVEPRNTLALRDIEIDLGADDLTSLFAGSAGRVRLDMRDLAGLIDPRGAPIERLPEHRLTAVAALEEGRLRVLEGRFDTPGGSLILTGGSARAERGPRPLSGAPAPLRVRHDFAGLADFESLEPLTAILQLGDFAGDLRGRFDLKGVGADIDASATLAGSGVVAAGWSLGAVDLDIALNGGRLAVRRLVAAQGDESLEATGAIVLYGAGRTAVPLEFDDVVVDARIGSTWEALAPRLGTGVPALERLSARVELDGTLAALRADVSASAQGLVLGDERFGEVAFDLVARPRSDGEGVEIERVHARASSPFGEVEARGSGSYAPDVLRVRLEEFDIARGEERLSLERPIEYERAAGSHRLERTALSGSSGAIAVELDGPDDGIQIRVLASQLDIAPFAGRFLPAELELSSLDLNGRVRLGSGGVLREAEIRANTPHLRPRAHLPASELTIDARWSEDTLTLAKLEAHSDAGDRVQLEGQLPLALSANPFAAGAIAVSGYVRIADASRWLPADTASGDLQLGLELGGSWSALKGDLSVDALELRFGAADSPVGQLGAADVSARWSLDGTSAQLDELQVRWESQATLALRGDLEIPLDAPEWARDRFAALRHTPFDFTGKAAIPHLEWLVPLLPRVRTLAGAARIEDIRLRGTFEDMERDATLHLRGVLVKFDSDLPAIDDLVGALELSRRVVTPDEANDPDAGKPFEAEVLDVRELQATAGGSPLELRGWIAPFETEPIVSLEVVGEDLLLYRTPDTTVRADAELWLSGPAGSLHLSGTVEPTSARFTRNVNFLNLGRGGRPSPRRARGIELFSLRNPPLSTMTFDVRVRAREPFRIENNFARGSLLPDITLKGSGEVPIIEGPIYLQPTRIALPATRLRFTGGTILFEREDPFVPQLNLRAETRMRGYEIEVQVLGPYDDPDILMTSVPPLPPQDVAVLVATGQLPDSALTAEGGARTARLVALYLVQDISSQIFGRDDGGPEDNFVERFEVSTGRDVSRKGQETIEGSFLLWEGRILADERGLITVERDIYDDVNFGLRLVLRFP